MKELGLPGPGYGGSGRSCEVSDPRLYPNLCRIQPNWGVQTGSEEDFLILTASSQEENPLGPHWRESAALWGNVCLRTTQQTIQRPATMFDVGSLHPLCWDFTLLSRLERPYCRNNRQKEAPISQSECCPSQPQNHHKSATSHCCG